MPLKKNEKRNKAILIATIVGVLLVIPVAYLGYLETRDFDGEMKSYGSVPEFALVSRDGVSALTHYDTYRRVTVVANFVSSCAASECDLALQQIEKLKLWADSELISRQSNDSKPQDIQFIVISEKPITTAMLQFEANKNQPFLIPAAYNNDPNETVVVSAISQDSNYEAVIGSLDPHFAPKLKRLLSSLTSEAYLFHYLTMQSLMWQRAKDYARGKISTGEESKQ